MNQSLLRGRFYKCRLLAADRQRPADATNRIRQQVRVSACLLLATDRQGQVEGMSRSPLGGRDSEVWYLSRRRKLTRDYLEAGFLQPTYLPPIGSGRQGKYKTEST